MPTFRHGINTKIYFDKYDLSGYFNEASVSREVEMAETTAFGGGGAKTYIAGLLDGKITLQGMFDGQTTGGSDQTLSTILGSTTDSVVTILPDGFANPSSGTARRAIIAAVQEASYEIGAPVGDLVSAQAELQSDDGIYSGGLLMAATSISTATTTNSSHSDLGALGTNGIVGSLHVTANANIGSTSVKLQYSADNNTSPTTWADFPSNGSFTSITASTTTSERIAIPSGTNHRHIRAVVTTANTGAIVLTIAFARR